MKTPRHYMISLIVTIVISLLVVIIGTAAGIYKGSSFVSIFAVVMVASAIGEIVARHFDK